MKHFVLTTIFVCIISAPLSGTVQATGDGATPNTFSTAITTKVYDRANGTLFFGRAAAGTMSIARVSRYSGYGTPAFTGIATNTLLSGQTIAFMTLAGFLGNPSPRLGIVTSNSITQALLSKTDGSIVTQSAVLNDASGAADVDGSPTSGIVGLAGNQNFLFSAVMSSTANFGVDQNGGIAVININQATMALQQTAAVAGDSGIKAAPLGPTSSQIIIGAMPPTIVPNVVDLFWDDPLQRLYIGLEMTTSTTATNGARSVVVANVSSAGVLTYNNFAPAAAFNAGNTTNIIGAVSAGTPLSLSAIKVRVMHNTTGASYLIVNGGNDIATNATNQLYALPLVDLGDPLNATQGVLANKNSFNASTHRFETPAVINADLTSSIDPAARVGDSPLPLNTTVGEQIADMVVVADTVYVSTLITTDTTAQTRNGVFYSEALFDQTGRIVRWTPWTKRAVPSDPNLAASKLFFDVDAVNGKIWVTNGPLQVFTTAWDYGSNAASLTTILSSALNRGSYSVLDLDQSTRGLGFSAPGRYALFGGLGTVAFARTSVSTNLVAPFDRDAMSNLVAQTVPTNFSAPQNFLITSIGGPAGAVQVLEYSRRLSGTADNYFFAGTQNGLYVFSTNGNGFNVGTAMPNNLNAAPFAGGSWTQATAIQGSVVDIKTTGQTLYVMTLQSSPANPIKSKIFSINFQPTVDAMFALGNIQLIAESEVSITGSDLSNAKIFQGMQILVTDATVGAEEEQLVVATNRGIYGSHAIGGVNNVANQAAALWRPVDASDTTAYYNIAAADMGITLTTVSEPIAPTTWPVSIINNGGGIRQLNEFGLPFSPAFVPTQFNANALTDTTFANFPPITFFWSEGARRFFIVNQQANCSGCNYSCGGRLSPSNNLLISPYNVIEWNVTTPLSQIVSDPALATTGLYTWARHLGDTGIFMVGTGSGVVALE